MADEMDTLNDALTEWVRQHPHPNDPTVSMMGHSYSPREILDEVHRQTPFGKSLVGFLNRSSQARGVRPDTLIREMVEVNQRFTLHHAR